MMDFSWFDTSQINADKWTETCETGRYAILQPNDLAELLPGFPSGFLDKTDSILLVASGSPDGVAYYMVNFNRVDVKAQEIDQHPFGLAFIGNEPLPSGCFVHHGDWECRSTSPPPEFWKHIQASGLGTCYPIDGLPDKRSGSIEELNVESQEDTFPVVVAEMSISVQEAQVSSDSDG